MLSQPPPLLRRVKGVAFFVDPHTQRHRYKQLNRNLLFLASTLTRRRYDDYLSPHSVTRKIADFHSWKLAAERDGKRPRFLLSFCQLSS
jgi:hypothetical protein